MHKKIWQWNVLFAIGLIVSSALLYWGHYVWFKDAHHIFIYLMGDIAFVPIEILLVTIIIHRLLSAKEKQHMMSKLNMVIGTFFSVVGTELLRQCVRADEKREPLSTHLLIQKKWRKKDFRRVRQYVVQHVSSIRFTSESLIILKQTLEAQRAFFVDLLGNPNLLEHEAFSDLLWGVFHLVEELSLHESLSTISEDDMRHLVGDTHRVYHLLLREWVQYMEHLHAAYPYLFSLAMRTNPFDRRAVARH